MGVGIRVAKGVLVDRFVGSDCDRNWTALAFLPQPFDVRARFYETLIGSKLFALGGFPLADRRSFGMRVWDNTHVYLMLLALLSLPIGVPLGLWFGLDLGNFFNNDLASKVDTAQLLMAGIIGAIAVNVFLYSQLPRLAKPRVVCRFFEAHPSHVDAYLERFVVNQRFVPGEARWVFLRITNVGSAHYSGLKVSCEIPDDWLVDFTVTALTDESPPRYTTRRTSSGGSEEPPTMPEQVKAYRFFQTKNQVDFDTNSNPLETGPGSTSVYPLFIRADSTASAQSAKLRVKIAASEAGGTAIVDLGLQITDGNVHEEDSPDAPANKLPLDHG